MVKFFLPAAVHLGATAPATASPLLPRHQLRHWQNKYRDIPSILFHDKYGGRNFQYRPILIYCPSIEYLKVGYLLETTNPGWPHPELWYIR